MIYLFNLWMIVQILYYFQCIFYMALNSKGKSFKPL